MRTTDENRSKLEAYAWPGGYPVMYLATDGWREDDGTLTVTRNEENACCAKCAADTVQWPDLVVVGQYVHYEGAPEYCEYCNGFTDSAYGDPAEDEDESDGPTECGNCGAHIPQGECPLCDRKCDMCGEWVIDCKCAEAN